MRWRGLLWLHVLAPADCSAMRFCGTRHQSPAAPSRTSGLPVPACCESCLSSEAAITGDVRNFYVLARVPRKGFREPISRFFSGTPVVHNDASVTPMQSLVIPRFSTDPSTGPSRAHDGTLRSPASGTRRNVRHNATSYAVFATAATTNGIATPIGWMSPASAGPAGRVT